MKLTTFGNENAATAGAQREIAIGFQANAVAFYAQISGLAEDKVGYPMRELNTNSWDATRARYGNDIPEDRRPELTLPTALNPIFKVRDYGYGMSQHLMETVYGQMYASTKRESTEEVGGWGIGRFSSFGYLIGREGAASYRVTSIADEPDGRRLKTIWTVSINRNGTPVLRELMSVETIEETGLEVSFDVRKDDIATFQARARQILWSFEPRPRITPEITWAEEDVVATGANWSYHRSSSVPFHGPHVRMGCVIYPIDLAQIDTADVNLRPNESILIEAPIGSVSVSLSRESLAYDERTISTLNTLVAGLHEEIRVAVQAKVDAATTYFEACATFEREAGQIGSRQGRLRPSITWRGFPLRERLDSVDWCKFMQLGQGWTTFEKFDRGPARLTHLSGTLVVVEHRPFYSMERFAEAGHVGKSILWVRVKKDRLAEAMELLGNPEYVVLDETKVDATPRAKDPSRRMIRRRRTIEAHSHGGRRETQDVDLSAGGVYMTEIQGNRIHYYSRRRQDPTFDVFGDGNGISWGNLIDALENLVKLEILPAGTPILLKAATDELGPNWVPLGKKVERRLKRKIDLRRFSGLDGKSTYSLDQDVRRVVQTWSFEKAPADLKTFKQDAKAIYEALSQQQGTVTVTDRAVSAIRALGKTVEIPEFECPVQAINTRWSQLEAKYPVVEILMDSGSHRVQRTQPHLDHYFELLTVAASVAPLVAPPADNTDEIELAEAA